MQKATIEKSENTTSEKNKDWVVKFESYPGDLEEPDQVCAILPFRNVACVGDTMEEAAGSLVKYYAELAYMGSVHPECPDKMGAPPLQHVMQILNKLLQDHLRARQEEWEGSFTSDDGPSNALDQGSTWTKDPKFLRRNEVISGLSTAIASLARIKEL